MGKYVMEQLKEKFLRELETMADKRDLSSTDLERAYKLTGTVKNLCKLSMMDDGGYSGDDYSRSYDRGSSYRRDSMGRYASRGYSRDSGYSGGTMEEHLDAMLRDARTEEDRRLIEDMRRKLA